jgi:proteasome lid subunit RPN8/RPN11
MSEQQNRIVFGQTYERITVPEEAMPEHSRAGPLGSNVPRESPFQVFLCPDVQEAMWRHARGSPRLECAGALFGHPFVQPETLEPSGVRVTFVIVAVAVPYTTPEQTRGHVRVTAEALAEADAYVARDHAGLQAVGWYHTHPGHGIFLSGYDLVITRSIFNAAWHVAVVLDPLRNEMGLFQGADGERLPGYRILRELPMGLALMQIYNQGCGLMAADRLPEALQRFQKLEKLFQENQDLLPFWRGKSGYRDTDQCLRQLENVLQGPGHEPPVLHLLERPEVPQTTEEDEVTPRVIGERVADRALEAVDRGGNLMMEITRWPARTLLRGIKSAASHLSRRTGGTDG